MGLRVTFCNGLQRGYAVGMFQNAKLNRRHKAVIFLTVLAVGVCLILGKGLRVASGVALLGLAIGWLFGSNSKVVHALFVMAGLLCLIGPPAFDRQDHRSQARLYQKRVAEFERRIPEFARDYPQPSMLPGRVGIGRTLKVLYPELQPYSDESVADVLLARTQTFPIPEDQSPDEFTKGFAPNDGAGLAIAVPKTWTSKDPKTGRQLIWDRNRNVWRPIADDQHKYLELPDGRYVDIPTATINELKAKFPAAIRRDFPQLPSWHVDAIASGIEVSALAASDKPGDPPQPFSLGHSLSERWPLTLAGISLVIVGMILFLAIKDRYM